MNESEPSQQGMIQEPMGMRKEIETPDIESVKQAVEPVTGAIYQGLGTEGLLIAIKNTDTAQIRAKLSNRGITIENKTVNPRLNWVGFPRDHSLYYITDYTEPSTRSTIRK